MWKMNFFSRSEKSQGNLLHFRETCKGLEKSGNWKINGLGSVKKFTLILFKGKGGRF